MGSFSVDILEVCFLGVGVFFVAEGGEKNGSLGSLDFGSFDRELCVFIHHSLKLTFSHLKMEGWKTILSFWVLAYFQVLLLFVLGSVKGMEWNIPPGK